MIVTALLLSSTLAGQYTEDITFSFRSDRITYQGPIDSAWLMLDGREIARGVAEGTPQQEPDARFEVSPPEAPLPGAVDEVRWFVYVMAPAQQLPVGLEPAQPYRFTFDARGEPVEQPQIRFLTPEEIK